MNESPPFSKAGIKPKGLNGARTKKVHGGLHCSSFMQLLMIFVFDDREGSPTVLILESWIT